MVGNQLAIPPPWKKGLWLWNLPTVTGNNKDAFREMIGVTGVDCVLLKIADGSAWYNDDPQLPRYLRYWRYELGLLVGTWSYHYFDVPDGEFQRVDAAIDLLGSDTHAFNVEDPVIESTPGIAWKALVLMGQIRRRHPSVPLLFTSFAQPSYHERQPYWQAQQVGCCQAPMIYHTAMQMTPTDAVDISVTDLLSYDLLRNPFTPVGAAYGSRSWPITADGITEWSSAALAKGATALSWWSADELMLRPELWPAIGAVAMP